MRTVRVRAFPPYSECSRTASPTVKQGTDFEVFVRAIEQLKLFLSIPVFLRAGEE